MILRLKDVWLFSSFHNRKRTMGPTNINHQEMLFWNDWMKGLHDHYWFTLKGDVQLFHSTESVFEIHIIVSEFFR